MGTNTEHVGPVPLSSDLELRPRGTEPVSLQRALEPSQLEWLEDTLKAHERLYQLANQARATGNLEAELRVMTKAASLSFKLLRLCLDQGTQEE